MDNAGYVSLSRQSGLVRELNTIANNIANASTGGFRRESVIFDDYMKQPEAGGEALSVATASRHFIDFSAGEIKASGNPLDFAIDGDGFFLVETPNGPRLTRAGSFTLNGNSEIVTGTGQRVLDESGGALLIPPEAAKISVSADGSITADSQAVGRIGVVRAEPDTLVREGDNMFRAEEGYTPSPSAKVRQGAIETSNVNPITEIAHLIEVQRAYEMGQKFLESDDQRIERAVRELGQT
jgi:flagellar basal-body rod protein FlgF